MDSSTQTLISISIIGAVLFIFGSVAAICCVFKSRCKQLYDANEEPDRFLLRYRDQLSRECMSTADSGETFSFRKTLFEIFMKTTEKPTRAVCPKNLTFSRSLNPNRKVTLTNLQEETEEESDYSPVCCTNKNTFPVIEGTKEKENKKPVYK